MRLPCFNKTSLSLYSSKQARALECTGLSTRVHRPVHWSGIIRMKAGKHNNVCYERHAICLLNIQTTAILTHTY